MNSDIGFVFALIGVAAVLMASNRVRYDLVALIVVLGLILGNILSVGEALSGFGSSVVILVAGLLIVGEMLQRTGVARSVGDLILKHGGTNETQLLILLMVSAGFLGSVMSSTAVVAIFIPIVLRIAAETGLDKSRLLLPMSYAALISGMLTLIATTPNLVVSDELVAQGYTALGFFSFFPIGVLILGVTIVYMLVWGRSQLGAKTTAAPVKRKRKSRAAAELWTAYHIQGEVYDFWVGGPVPLEDVRAMKAKGAIFEARRRRARDRERETVLFRDGMELQRDDLVLVRGPKDVLEEIASRSDFTRRSAIGARAEDWQDSLGMADVMVHPEASILGETPAQALAHETPELECLGILRSGEPISVDNSTVVQAGDRMLVLGPWDELEQLVEMPDDFVLLTYPKERENVVPMLSKFGVAIAILFGMVVLSALNIVPVTVAVLLAAVAAILFRTMSAEQAYASISLPTIVLIAGMLPLANALETTGGSEMIVDHLLSVVGEANPRVMMAALFLLTAALGLVLSNTASAVLVAPIAITAAEAMGISPYPLAISVLIAASAAFSTPVSTPVVTLVVTPGGYAFSDFLKLGVPLTLVVGLVTVLVTPFLFPY
ncbi:SLC13 family permease [Roseibium alexandrii]|uniref:SLC13 family permease n=1 Tax=Roseibium alexandrii TaxID=388408 RepID=UPI0039EE477F